MINHKLQVNILLSLVFMTFINLSDLFSQSNSVIGLSLEFSAPMGVIENADKVYFIKLSEDSTIEETKRLFRSNFTMDNQIYLTDVEPGKYTIVALGKEKVLPIYGLTELTTFLSEALIKESVVTVDSNDFVYMGNYSLSTKMMTSNKKSDNIQMHYFRIISGRKRVPRYMRQIFLDSWYYRAALENTEINRSSKNDFYMKALEYFQGLDQEEIIRRGMIEKL